jgi:virginiamycin B lyase
MVDSGDHWELRIGRIGPSGPIGETPIPTELPAEGIVVGLEGDAWLLGSWGRVGRLAPSGAFTLASIPRGQSTPHATAARDGGVWFTGGRGSEGPDTIGRIDLSGAMTEFPLPRPESGPGEIVEASDGNAWFTEYFDDRIGRMTPSGKLTEFPLPEESRPSSIAADAHGNVWFAEQGLPHDRPDRHRREADAVQAAEGRIPGRYRDRA